MLDLNYELRWQLTGADAANGETFRSLDLARDVAWALAAETGQTVMIVETFGQSENLVEIY